MKRRLTSIEYSIEATIQRLEDFIKKSKEILIITDSIKTNRITITLK